MDYRAASVCQQGMELATLGWKMVRLWGVRDDGSCTCGTEGCTSAGKHPAMGGGWQFKASCDEQEIASWYENIVDTNQSARRNIGVRLGRVSGIIDIEYDSDEGKATLHKWGLNLVDTPNYSAERGIHHIFAYEDDLPDVGFVKIDGLEVRIGGGDQASQSVVPCSWHYLGKQYKWLPERSPSEVAPAKLPEAFKVLVLANSKKGGSGAIAQARDALSSGSKITAGGRHAFLLGLASRQCQLLGSSQREFTLAEKREVLAIVKSLNQTECTPPKDVDEVKKIVDDQFAYYKERQQERRGPRRALERLGLRWNSEAQEYEPGEWKVVCVRSEPVEYKLSIPYNDRKYVVSIDPESWITPKSVCKLILNCLGDVNVADTHPSKWSGIWNGETVRDGENLRNVEGLNQKLLRECEHEFPASDSSVYYHHASTLWNWLNRFDQFDDDSGLPLHDGTPKWLKGADGVWKLYFKSSAAYQIAFDGKLPITDQRALKKKILEITGEKDFPTKKFEFAGKSGRWWVWTEKHIDALQKLMGV